MATTAVPASAWGSSFAATSNESVTTPEPEAPVTWPAAIETSAPASVPAVPAAAEQVDIAELSFEAPPVAVPAPITTAGPVPNVIAEETINDAAENKVNIAMFHIQRLQQLIPDVTGWSEEQAASVNKAIVALDRSLKGREDASDPYHGLRETVKAAKTQNRDIDVMVALTDRAGEIEDLLKAHDAYSKAVREALYAIKPAAVNYIAPVKRRPAARRASTTRTSTKSTARTTTTPAPSRKK